MYTIKQAFETKVGGGDSEYWIIVSPDGQAVASEKTQGMAELAARIWNQQTTNLRNRNMELEAENAKMKDQLQAVRNAANMAEISQILQDFDDGIELEVVKNLKLQFAYAQGMAEGTKRTLFNEALTIKSLDNMIEFFSKITGFQSPDSATEQAPTAQAASEVPAALDKPFYSVKEHVDTMYKTDEYSGKRYPSDYSVFIVVGPNGKAVDSFSALTHGLDDAEYLANELRDKLNKAVQS